MMYEVLIDEKPYQVELTRSGAGWRCQVNGRPFPADVAVIRSGVLSLLAEGKSYEIKLDASSAGTIVVVGNARFRTTVRDPRSLRSRRRAGDSDSGIKRITAPMPGKVVRVLTPPGTDVESGQPVLVIEAMKMQNELKSPKKGKVKRLAASEGAAVEAGQVLAEVE